MDGDDALVRAAVHVRVEDGDRVGVPAELQVALVGEEQDAVLAGPGDDPGQLGLGEDLAGGVGRRVQPEELEAGRVQGRRVVVALVVGAREAGAHLVRRVGQARVGDPVAGAEAQLGGEPGDQFLGADDRQDVVVGDVPGAEAALQPARDRVTQSDRAPHGGVARRVRRGDQSFLDQVGHRVDGGADGEVDDPTGVSGGRRFVRLQLVPGEGGESVADCGHGI